MIEPDTGNLVKAQQSCRLEAPVASKDRATTVDEQGIGKSEGFNAVGNLPDLLSGVRTRIAQIG